jgi:hypothetical protein
MMNEVEGLLDDIRSDLSARSYSEEIISMVMKNLEKLNEKHFVNNVMGSVEVTFTIKRPDGYQDVHSDLVVEDFLKNPEAFEVEWIIK